MVHPETRIPWTEAILVIRSLFRDGQFQSSPLWTGHASWGQGCQSSDALPTSMRRGLSEAEHRWTAFSVASLKTQNRQPQWAAGFSFGSWCRRGDSNPHGLPHTPLKRARLPVPPLRLGTISTATRGALSMKKAERDGPVGNWLPIRGGNPRPATPRRPGRDARVLAGTFGQVGQARSLPRDQPPETSVLGRTNDVDSEARREGCHAPAGPGQVR